MKILSFGEILWDVYPDQKHIGGASFNFAAHLAKHGEEVWMLSALGQDDLGEAAKRKLKEMGVSSQYVSVLADKETGKCLVTLDEKSIPAYHLLQDVAYDYISCDHTPDGFDVLYFGTLALRSRYNDASLKRLLQTHSFQEIFVDVNIRPPFYSKESVRFSVQNATILKISLEELPLVSQLLEIQDGADYKAFAEKLAAQFTGLKCIVITLGAEGAFALDCIHRKEYSCGCEKMRVASTVGAGDSFSAAFLHQYLRRNNIQFCLEYASKVAGFVVSKFDAVPDYAVKDFL